ncbi:GntR family transcriptional regulator [Actinopolymorpha pittospori]|uniref:DNA-binding GntR family transcriptional regulator n=1 Tax=Actinopolymorpha pittospori TaxID=648752 RepID=A0A927MT48_9ACTN|nr:GntR family transcriptional regulator [Actinopolymorpha pittospori]MBE1604348.1 DNA-binding GntR family transcriptional regulator [Actinopolymorpha pittospori]
MASDLRLIQAYGISRGTARRAIAVLVDEGPLVVAPQCGTYVK